MRTQVSRARQVLKPDVELVKGFCGTLAALTESDTVERDVTFCPDEFRDFFKDVTWRFVSGRQNAQSNFYHLLHRWVEGEAKQGGLVLHWMIVEATETSKIIPTPFPGLEADKIDVGRELVEYRRIKAPPWRRWWRWWTRRWLHGRSERVRLGSAHRGRELLNLTGECCNASLHSGHPGCRVSLSVRLRVVVSRHDESPTTSRARARKVQVDGEVIARRCG